MKKICCLLGLCLILTFSYGCNQTQQIKSDSHLPSVNTEVESSKTIQPIQLDEKSLLPGIEKIIKRGTLRVAMVNIDVDGFCETQEDGSLTGIDAQLAKDIANSMGVSLTINRESDSWDKLTELLANDEVDLVISTYSLTTTRATSVKISNPYLTSRFGVMVNKQELVKNKIEKNPIDYMQNNEIKIAAIRGSSHVNLASEFFPKAKIVEMDSYKDMYTAVRNGDVFGYICGELRFLCDYNEDAELSLYTKVFVFSDALEKYCVGVSPDNTDLLNFVNAYIDSSKEITVKDYEDTLKNESKKDGK